MANNVAFIGLGNMGGPMAGNLVKAGYTVYGFDPVEAARNNAEAAGVIACATGAEAVANADVVITMLPNGNILKAAYGGEDGFLKAAPAGALFIDCSTVDVADAREASHMAADAGHRPGIDAPVSGGIVGAQNATLTFMVGASDEGFTAAKPVLEAMGKNIIHCGESGAGQAVKICNNMVLAISMIGVSEAFVLAESLGVDPQVFFDVASTATASCWALNTNCPVPGPVPTSPANRDFQPGFAGALMSKDLGLAANAISQTGTDAKMGSLAVEIYKAFADGEGAAKDFSGIINTIRENS
ncbi:MAG: 3-hydroxyisobutyrate dehydrogenase [Corynebacterium sp.]|uniref:3-hydroxyisobutyrate dehydrogenase n=1 Tax=Corynebacterium sp. TaxID=1720 RepID=UPI0026DBD5DB|nr:3-hydroxyisobutyrate dehydrogenase [Corynebacterium sp.]MDO5097244.1 3-hydroxyisobutyrate dehydrogenase [Corynebacterium sp.]